MNDINSPSFADLADPEAEPTGVFISKYSIAHRSPTNPAFLGSEDNFSTIAKDNSGASILGGDQQGQPKWTIDHSPWNQNIRSHWNRQREDFIVASFLANSDGGRGFVTFPGLSVFASPGYNASFIFADTLKSLGHEYNKIALKQVWNPRGGRLQPIGVATLFVKFPGVENNFNVDDAFYIKLVSILAIRGFLLTA